MNRTDSRASRSTESGPTARHGGPAHRPVHTWRQRLADVPLLTTGSMLLGTATALALAHGWRALPTSEQHRTLLWAMARGADPQLSIDPLARTADPQPVFSFLFAPFLDVFGDAGATVAWFGAALLLFGSLWWLTGGLKRSTGQNLLWLGLMAAAASPIAAWTGFTETSTPGGPGLLSGFAGESILGESLSASAARALAVAGVALAIRGARPLIGSGTILAATIIEPGFAASGLIIVGAVTAAELLQTRPNGRPTGDDAASTNTRVSPFARVAVIAVALGFCIAANHATFSLLWDTKGEPAAEILRATTRSAVASPVEWPPVNTIMVFGFIAATVYVTRSERRRVARHAGQFVIIASILAALATVATIVSGRSTWVLLLPWQATTVAVPVAVALVADRIAATIDDRAFQSVIVRFGSAFVAVALSLAGVAAGVETTRQSPPVGQPKIVERLQASAESVTPLREVGVGLVHPDLGELRLDARAPISGAWNAAPATARAILDWKRSNDRSADAFRTPESACEIIEASPARWVVIPVTLGWQTRTSCTQGWDPQLDGDWLLLVRPDADQTPE